MFLRTCASDIVPSFFSDARSVADTETVGGREGESEGGGERGA